MEFEEVPLADIRVDNGRRPTVKDRVESLSRSISQLGLLSPIGLTRDRRLVYGRHRLEAFEMLGRTVIPARIHDLGALEAELAEIDENLAHHPLTAFQEALALKRRKELYLAIHPETRPGGDRKSGTTRHNGDRISFTEDTAHKTGKNRRTVERSVKLAEDITDAAAIQLEGTRTADNKAELKRLAAMDEEQQFAVATTIGQGKAKTVAAAMKLNGIAAKLNPAETEPACYAREQIKVWADTIGRWLSRKPSIDDLRGDWPGSAGDRVVKAATELYEALKLWSKAIQ